MPENYANFFAQLVPQYAAHAISSANDSSVPSQTPRPSVSTSVSSQAEDADCLQEQKFSRGSMRRSGRLLVKIWRTDRRYLEAKR